MSPSRIAANTSAVSPSSPCRRGWVTGVHGGSRSSAKPGSLTICHRSFEVEQPVDVVDLALLDLERVGRAARAAAAFMPGVDLDAHDLAEAPAAQLVLDRLQQVVGLVGDLEVGVARDAEDAVRRRSPCPGTARRGCRR